MPIGLNAGQDSFTLFDFDGTGDTVGLLDGSDVLTGRLADGSPFSFTLDVTGIRTGDADIGGRIILNVIPEPASTALIFAGVVPWLLRRP